MYTNKIINAKAICEKLLEDFKIQVQKLDKKPSLAVVRVGKDPASKIYVQNKQKACFKVGINSVEIHLPEESSQEEIIRKINELNKDPQINAILVQLPLPNHIDEYEIINKIDPKKDVDGFHPDNISSLFLRRPKIRSCTPKGIMMLLESIKYDVKGKDALIIGQSNIVGRPMFLELLLAGATVSIAHSKTKDLPQKIKNAELLVVAIGKPEFIKGEWIRENATVIDVGINRLNDGRIVGDVDFESAIPKVNAITKVPGGVGLMTVTALLSNTIEIASYAAQIKNR